MDSSRQTKLSSRELAIVRRWASGLEKSGSFEIAVFCRIDAHQTQLFYHGEQNLGVVEKWFAAIDWSLVDASLDRLDAPFHLISGNFIGIENDYVYLGVFPAERCYFLCSINPDAPFEPSLFSQLASASWRYEMSADELHRHKSQRHEFVKQVTKDFEELTWLRSVSQNIGNATFRQSIEELVSTQLPKLRQVIDAEFIGLVPIEIMSGSESNELATISTSGALSLTTQKLIAFVKRCEANSKGVTSVFNTQSSSTVFDGFPDLRNCIFTRLEKNGNVYGYLLALNKEVDFFCQSPEQFLMIDPNGFQFGTFEAGLLASLGTILASHAANSELFREQEQLVTGVIRAVINAIDAKDQYTCGHSDRVAEFSKAIALQMGLDEEECERIYLTGLLHDVGKIGVPDSILSKPDKLTDEEFEKIKKHPEIGYNILKHLKPLAYVLPGVMHHHEALNGKGYPHGLVGEQIPLAGRIIAVADSYDAMTSDRPYRKGMPSEKAESILCKEAGSTWDELAVYAIMECISKGIVSPQSTSKPDQPAIPSPAIAVPS
ncbi:MAG: HD-GYP domain-containing protein [Pirellula sp.]|jgi:hypothetical protein|nr:HD-GYP domain-containing protein [Pirellula sp.]